MSVQVPTPSLGSPNLWPSDQTEIPTQPQSERCLSVDDREACRKAAVVPYRTIVRQGASPPPSYGGFWQRANQTET